MKSKEPAYRAAYWKTWAEKNSPPVTRPCAICSAIFSPHGPQKRCLPCRTSTCPQCNVGFITNVKGRKFCSRRCLALAHIETLHANRGTKPRTYHLRHRDKHGCAADREWRIAVFSRDNFTCQRCGLHGGRLEAHHIKPFKAYPQLRHRLSNGLTLCKPCHRETDSYGWQGYWKTQIAAKRLSQEVFDFGEAR
jgi:5-methylcytosine-specific restriction endonuclease McrA